MSVDNFIPVRAAIDNPIEYLAGLLAQNHVNISLSNSVLKNHNKVYKEIFNENTVDFLKDKYNPLRCIVIVGAGADHNACKALQLGKYVANELKNTLTKNKIGLMKNDELFNLVENELERLKRIYKLNPEEYETVLFALNKYFPVDLADELRRKYAHCYNPCLTYEILAHLMKHRFIDAIINFNFSELLDQSIKDELKDDEYHKIVFDGDVDPNTFDQDKNGELKIPLYVKPHGTISHYSTLRFTEEAYYGLPTEINTLLTKLIGANWNDKKGNKAYKNDNKTNSNMKVVLIVMGFNMQSSEFNIILNENLPPNSQIFFINSKESRQKPEIDYRYLSNKAPFDKTNLENIMTNGNNSVLIQEDHNSFMMQLWKCIEGKFQTKFRPRDIQRHILIAKLFNKEVLRDTYKEVNKYLWQRAYVEFALSVAKYKGFITQNQIDNDRFGKYLHLAIRSEEIKTENEEKNQSSAHYSKPKNLRQFIEGFDLKEFGYGSSKTYKLPSKKYNEDNRFAKYTNITISKDEFFDSDFCSAIIKKLRALKLINNSNVKKFNECLNQTYNYLHNKEDTEISTKYENVYSHIFTNPTIIKSQLEFKYKTWLYLNENWDELHIVAETGEWLVNLLESKNGKTLRFIYADEEWTKKIDRLFVKNLNSIWLPWWEHNQHLTLFLKGNKIQHAFYFTRRLRSSLINPVEIDKKDENGLKVLREIFAAYCIKAKNVNELLKVDIEDKMKELYPEYPL